MEFCSKQTMKKVYDHIRYLSNRQNRINQSRQWDLDHPKEAKNRKHNWYIKVKPEHSRKMKLRHQLHKKDDNLRDKNYYYKNRENQIKKVSQYQKDNLDKVNSKNRSWRKRNPKKNLQYHYNSLKKQVIELGINLTAYRRALQAWSLAVKIRDNFTCQICGSKTNVEAHHILQKSLYPKLSLNINNGISLCDEDHDFITYY